MPSNLTIEKRSPPSNVRSDAMKIVDERKAARVKIHHTGDGWQIRADGPGTPSNGPPIDIDIDEWDGRVPYISGKNFDDFVESIKDNTEPDDINPQESRSDAMGYWKIELEYYD